jgi:hypothetical protein
MKKFLARVFIAGPLFIVVHVFYVVYYIYLRMRKFHGDAHARAWQQSGDLWDWVAKRLPFLYEL